MVAFMPERKNPVVGGVLELRCDVTSSDQNIKLSWTKDQTPLLPSPRVVMQNKNQLVTIYNITSADSGQYQCIANGDLSTAVSTFVNVHSKGTNISCLDYFKILHRSPLYTMTVRLKNMGILFITFYHFI